MLFITRYKVRPGKEAEGWERFKKSGGVPPAGVRMIARYHSVSTMGGYTVSETDDAAALGSWAKEWRDILDLEVEPVFDDATAAKVMGA